MEARLVTFSQNIEHINIHVFEHYGDNNTFGPIYKLKESNDLDELNQINGIRIWINNRYTFTQLNLINDREWYMFCKFKDNLNSLNKIVGFDKSVDILFSIFERQISNLHSKKSLLNLAKNECWKAKIKEQELKEFMLNELPF